MPKSSNIIKFRTAEILFTIHATEDENLLISTISKNLGFSSKECQISDYLGHYENPVKIVRIHILSDQITLFTTRLFNSLSETDKKSLFTDISKHLDKHYSFYFRLDKQLLINNIFKISVIDCVRIKLKIDFTLQKYDNIKMIDAYMNLLR
jgi:RNA binding exosome subunit